MLRNYLMLASIMAKEVSYRFDKVRQHGLNRTGRGT